MTTPMDKMEIEGLNFDNAYFAAAQKSTWSSIVGGARNAAYYARPTVWHNKTMLYMDKANALDTWYTRKPAQIGLNGVAAVTGLVEATKEAVTFVVKLPVAIVALVARVTVAALRCMAPKSEGLKSAEKYLSKVLRSEVRSLVKCGTQLAGVVLSLGAMVGEAVCIGGSKLNVELQKKMGNISVALIYPKKTEVKKPAEQTSEFERETAEEAKAALERAFKKKQPNPELRIVPSKKQVRAEARLAKKEAKAAELAKKEAEKPVEQPTVEVIVPTCEAPIDRIRTLAASIQDETKAARKAILAQDAQKHLDSAKAKFVCLGAMVASKDADYKVKVLFDQKSTEASKQIQVAENAVARKSAAQNIGMVAVALGGLAAAVAYARK